MTTRNRDEQFKELREMLNAMQGEIKKGMGELNARIYELDLKVRDISDAMYVDVETGKPTLRSPKP